MLQVKTQRAPISCHLVLNDTRIRNNCSQQDDRKSVSNHGCDNDCYRHGVEIILFHLSYIASSALSAPNWRASIS